MAVSLYELSVSSFLQTVGAVAHVLERGRAHCVENGLAPDEIVDARLHPDMRPFRFQVQSVAHHSIGAIEGIQRGLFGPPGALPDLGYNALAKMLDDTRERLEALTPGDVNKLEGGDVVFRTPDFSVPFTAENFVLSFSIPNLHFHATTTYDILRLRGVPLGKRDYLGRMRIKR